MFGIGPYSFAPYKTAVSGLHRSPVFRAVGPVAGRPVLFDDTWYVLPFGAAESAALAAAVLNGPIAGRRLSAITWGGKRPVTKAALQRIDLAACLEAGDVPATLARADADLERLEGRPGRWGDHPAAWLAPAAPVPTPES
jgi:hypothetical protein